MKELNDVKITVRVEKELKESADRLFRQLGMNMTTQSIFFCEKQ